MHPDRFDDVAKALATAHSRRAALKVLAGGLAGLLLTARPRGPVQAQAGPPRQPPTCGSTAACPAGTYCRKPTGDCAGTGTCEPRPDACTLEYAPVCGCDGRTYSNACHAAMAGVSVAHQGECPCQPVGGRCRDTEQCCGEAICDRRQRCVCLVQAFCAEGFRWDSARCQCVPVDGAA